MDNKKIFGNPGLLQPQAFTTFGISAKGKDNAIGKFGTGLKYAIAVMAREGLELYIRSGEMEYTFESREIDFRGKAFNQIDCIAKHDDGSFNVIELPFTTEFGHNWELWQVYRELASNCLDEGGAPGESGETTIYADLDVAHSDVFLEDLPVIQQTSFGTIYSGESDHLYYQGIRVYKLDKPSRYTYSLNNASLTEDRTLTGLWEWQTLVCDWVARMEDEKVIQWFLTEVEDKYLENKMDMDYSPVPACDVSDSYRGIMSRFSSKVQTKNNSAFNHYYSGHGSQVNRVPEAMSESEAAVIAGVYTALDAIGYPQINDYQVHMIRHLGRRGDCMMDGKVIWISTVLMRKTSEEIHAEVFRELCLSLHAECKADSETWFASLAYELAVKNAELKNV